MHSINKKICFTGIIFFLLLVNSFAQTWYITRGLSTDEVAWAVDVDSSGNIYWAVEEKDQWPYWYYNIVLFKIAPNAQQIWQSNSWDNGTGFNDIAFKATVKDSTIYLSGRTDSTASPASGDALVTSYDANNGNFNWVYRFNPTPDYGYEEIDGVVVQPDGIYLSGWKQQQNTNDMDFLIQKINSSGQLVWSTTWDYNSLGKFDGANGHMAMDDNFLYIAGHVNRTNIGSLDGDGAIACFSKNNGSYQWHTTWGGSLYDDALGMTMGPDSMLYVVGYTGSYGNGSQTYLNKYSRSGILQWSRIWGGTGTEDSRSVIAGSDAMIYVAGATSSYGNGLKDIFVLKYDTAGTLLDSLFWGGAYDEIAHDAALSGDYLYITGETKSYGNGQINGDHKADGLLLKVDVSSMQAPDSLMTATLPSASISENIKFSIDYLNATASIFFNDPKNENFSVKAFNSIGQEIITHPEILHNGGHTTVYINFSGFPKGICFIQINKNDRSITKKIIIL